MRKARTWIVAGVVLLVAFGLEARAGKGGGKPGGGGGGPAADPAIAFTADGDLMVMNEDGSNVTRLRAGNHGRASWSPDGTRLAFWSDAQGPGIYTLGVDGTGLTKLVAVQDMFSIHAVAWSPGPAADGYVKIAWQDDDDIYVMNVDGSGVTNLTNTPTAREESPSWSPGADRLAVRVDDGTNVDAVVLSLGVVDGALAETGRFNLTSDADVPGGTLNGGRLGSLAWAKTGDRIVVAAPRPEQAPGPHDLWIIDLADPANPTDVTNTDDEEAWPSWSPDDAGIAHIVRPRGNGVYVSSADGLGRVRIYMNHKAAINVPSWRR